jgi:hypothetical protein
MLSEFNLVHARQRSTHCCCSPPVTFSERTEVAFVAAFANLKTTKYFSRKRVDGSRASNKTKCGCAPGALLQRQACELLLKLFHERIHLLFLLHVTSLSALAVCALQLEQVALATASPSQTSPPRTCPPTQTFLFWLRCT